MQGDFLENIVFETITDERQAKALSEDKSFAYFSLFLERERSVSEAAEEAGCSLEAMLYHVKKFVELDLLKVSSEQPRAGRPIKLYRSVHAAYFVPFALTPYIDLEDRLLKTMEGFQRRFVPSLVRLLLQHKLYGQKIYRAPNGDVWRSTAGQTADVNLDTEDFLGTQTQTDMYLTDDEARAFQKELRELWVRHHRGPEEAENRLPYAFSVAFAKLED